MKHQAAWNQFRVQEEEWPKNIETEMVLVTKSKYSDCSSMRQLNGWNAAYDYRSENYLEVDKKEYIPLLDRFQLSGVTVNDTVYLIRDGCRLDSSILNEDENQETISYSLPTADVPNTSDPVIIHGPELINGYQDDDFFVGVITNVHNKHGTMYTWFHNGNPIHFGEFLSLLRVDEPGIYHCKLSYNQIQLVSSSVNIVTKTPNQNKENSHNHAKKFRNVAPKGESSRKLESDKKYPASVSIASLVKAGTLAIPHKKQ